MLCVLVLIVAGGSNPEYPLARLVCELAGAALLLGAVLSRHSRRPALAVPDFILIAAIILCLLQIVPLPPSVWTHFGDRQFVDAIDKAFLGGPVWRPLSLTPERTIEATLTLLGPAGCYAALRTGDGQRTRALLTGVLVAALIAIAWSVLQRASGYAPWLYPYLLSDREFAVAFFTNHNHLSSFLLAALPLALILFFPRDGGAANAPGWMRLSAVAGLVLLTILGVLMSASRAGLVLLPVALAALALCLALYTRGHDKRIFLAGGGVVVAAILVLATQLWLKAGQLPALMRGRALSADRRFEFWPVAWDVAKQQLPTGSGFGSFPEIYARQEPLQLVSGTYVNHAHNDFLELFAEGGWVAILLVAFGLGWIAKRWISAALEAGSAAMKSDGGWRPTLLAGTAILTLMLHSLVDYPMRTAACASLFALAAGLLVKNNNSGLPR